MRTIALVLALATILVTTALAQKDPIPVAITQENIKVDQEGMIDRLVVTEVRGSMLLEARLEGRGSFRVLVSGYSTKDIGIGKVLPKDQLWWVSGVIKYDATGNGSVGMYILKPGPKPEPKKDEPAPILPATPAPTEPNETLIDVNIVEPPDHGTMVLGMTARDLEDYAEASSTSREKLLRQGGVWSTQESIFARVEGSWEKYNYVRPLSGPFQGRLVFVEKRYVGEATKLSVVVQPAPTTSTSDPLPKKTGGVVTKPAPGVPNFPNYSVVPQFVPRSSGGTVQVKGYTRKDGTRVKPHTRSAPRRK